MDLFLINWFIYRPFDVLIKCSKPNMFLFLEFRGSCDVRMHEQESNAVYLQPVLKQTELLWSALASQGTEDVN